MPEPYIVAEAAQGFEGKPEIAHLLVRAAAKAGADAVKFQIIYADDVAVAGYRYYDLFTTLEMSETDWLGVRNAARDAGIAFYADVVGPRAAGLADKMNIDGIKIHSTCFFEHPLLDWAFRTGKPIILSMGGIEESEVQSLIAERGLASSRDVVLMYGYQAEPTPIDKNVLARIPRLRQIYGLEIGFMDHSDGGGPDTTNLSAMALALGVRTFEKHITLDRALQLEDYVSALAPAEFGAYVSSMRRLAGALGTDSAAPLDEERSYREKALKRVVAARALTMGERLAPHDVVLKRTIEPDGLFDMNLAVGRTLTRPIAVDSPIRSEDLK